MKSLNRDGITLSYYESGTGFPTLIFIHGGMNNANYFINQQNHFKNYRTIVVDLRGHGQSDKPKQEYTIEGFAEDVAWMCKELQITNPVVIGHSMGGLVALELTASHNIPSAIVIMDSPIVPPAPFIEALGPFVEALKTPNWQIALNQFLESYVGFGNNPDKKQELIQDMLSSEQYVVYSSIENYMKYNSEEAVKKCDIPILYIGSGPPFSDLDRFASIYPKLSTAFTQGSGHYFHLEVPNQTNKFIDDFIQKSIQKDKIT